MKLLLCLLKNPLVFLAFVNLGNDKFAIRHSATNDIITSRDSRDLIPFLAALEKKHEDPEVRYRAKYIIDEIDQQELLRIAKESVVSPNQIFLFKTFRGTWYKINNNRTEVMNIR